MTHFIGKVPTVSNDVDIQISQKPASCMSLIIHKATCHMTHRKNVSAKCGEPFGGRFDGLFMKQQVSFCWDLLVVIGMTFAGVCGG